jgi:hypothetical protein
MPIVILLLLLLIHVLIGTAAHAACSETLVALPHSLGVSIGDGGCEYPQEMIINGQRHRPSPELVDAVSFDSQCQRTEIGFSCRSGGSTLLSGTAYKKVPGSKTICGNRHWPMYRCIAGCRQVGVPKGFDIEPYEC